MQGLMWFTQFENTKPVALVIFFTVFCGILFYVFGSRARGARLEAQPAPRSPGLSRRGAKPPA